MAKVHVLVKNLTTIKMLGCISMLCSNKTGTSQPEKWLVPLVPLSHHITLTFIQTVRSVAFLDAPTSPSGMTSSDILQSYICGPPNVPS